MTTVNPPPIDSDTSQQPAIAALQNITQHLADLIKGYEEMVDRAADDLKPIAQRLLALHQAHATELFNELSRLGGQPDRAGSVMGTVHVAVATARDWMNSLDSSAVKAIADGEEQLVHFYDDAIGKLPADAGQIDLLTKQRDDLKAHVTALRS